MAPQIDAAGQTGNVGGVGVDGHGQRGGLPAQPLRGPMPSRLIFSRMRASIRRRRDPRCADPPGEAVLSWPEWHTTRRRRPDRRPPPPADRGCSGLGHRPDDSVLDGLLGDGGLEHMQGGHIFTAESFQGHGDGELIPLHQLPWSTAGVLSSVFTRRMGSRTTLLRRKPSV